MAEQEDTLSFEEKLTEQLIGQLIHLRDVHNLAITNNAESALSILKKVNYYRLSSYSHGLNQRGNKSRYKNGITLEYIYRLYEFDNIFKNSLFRVIEQLENQIRTQISYYLAMKYGPKGYKKASLFIDKRNKDGKPVHEIIMERYETECERQGREKYEPIWAAIELFTFGNLSSLYSIMLPDDGGAIAKLYKSEAEYLKSWILALVEVRNICAHCGRLYNMPLKQTPYLYSEHLQYRRDRNKVFPVLLCIKRMLMNDGRWQVFKVNLEHIIDEYNDVIYLPYMGFPWEWKRVLLYS